MTVLCLSIVAEGECESQRKRGSSRRGREGDRGKEGEGGREGEEERGKRGSVWEK